MDTNWSGSVEINAPVEKVYSYLADFPRHCDWAQTLEHMEKVKDGDKAGVGARYLTIERQAFQANREPHGPLPDGAFKGKTLCEVTELRPNQRIAWHAHPKPRMRVWADMAFDLSPGSLPMTTKLTQTIHMHEGWLPAHITPLMFHMKLSEMEAKSDAQWQASLKNIKTILEEPGGGTVA